MFCEFSSTMVRVDMQVWDILFVLLISRLALILSEHDSQNCNINVAAKGQRPCQMK
jgi:hypothetical protein